MHFYEHAVNECVANEYAVLAYVVNAVLESAE